MLQSVFPFPLQIWRGSFLVNPKSHEGDNDWTGWRQEQSGFSIPGPGTFMCCMVQLRQQQGSFSCTPNSVHSQKPNKTEPFPAFYYIHYLLWASGIFSKTRHQLFKSLQIPQITCARAWEIPRECLMLCKLYLPRCNLAAAIYLHEDRYVKFP